MQAYQRPYAPLLARPPLIANASENAETGCWLRFLPAVRSEFERREIEAGHDVQARARHRVVVGKYANRRVSHDAPGLARDVTSAIAIRRSDRGVGVRNQQEANGATECE